MALGTGSISLRQAIAEFGGGDRLSQFLRGAGLVTTNNLSVPTTRAGFALSTLRGAVKATSGSLTFTSSGSMSVPPFQWLTATVLAGGGGGGGSNTDTLAGSAGGAGGNSAVTGAGANVVAYGGAGGAGSNYYGGVNYSGGSPRAADGSGSGGSVSLGEPGGTGGAYGYTHGQNGGYGGEVVRTFYPGDLTVGGTLSVLVGAGGAGGSPNGGAGTNGIVYISWG